MFRSLVRPFAPVALGCALAGLGCQALPGVQIRDDEEGGVDAAGDTSVDGQQEAGAVTDTGVAADSGAGATDAGDGGDAGDGDAGDG